MQGGRDRDGGGFYGGQSLAQFMPKNALRRSREFMKVGRVQDACEVLHNAISKRGGRTAVWTTEHEEMVIEFINLAVELRDPRRAKDGLYHYRQLAQTQAPASLDKVANYLVNLATRKATEARARADVDSATELAGVDDLEEGQQAPEALLMGAVTSEGSRERAEREILLPWVRHMWDTFRNVLDNLRYTPKLEHVYHAIAVKAMRFCKAYNRGPEFRKLCRMLRDHLVSSRRQLEQNNAVMSDESVERHLTTRFVQLESCADMSLWNEGFRTIEEIYEIMTVSDVTPKPQLMATYFEKLSRIFWVSENHLFHAYAWQKFFMLSATQNKSLSEDDRRNMASAVVLAALAIPVYAGGAGGGASSASAGGAQSGGLDIDSERDKKSKLAVLLRHSTIPSREALLADIAARGILKLVRPDVLQLYVLLEKEFSPLALVSRALPLLAALRVEKGATVASTGTLGGGSGSAANTLSQYVGNLERLLVFRLVEQLSAVYSTVRLTHFRSLVAGLTLSFNDVEKLIVRCVKNRQLNVRIDHRSGCLYLGNDSLETVETRRQLTQLATRLQALVSAILPPDAAAESARSDMREAVSGLARGTLNKGLQDVATRRKIIEKRKEDEERLKQQKDREDVMRQKEEAERQAQDAARRAVELERQKETARIQAIQAKLAMEATKQLLIAAGQDTSALDGGAQLSEPARRALEKEARDKAAKAQDEETKRRAEQAKRLDYIVRALREAERVRADAFSAALVTDDEAYVSKVRDDATAKAAERHTQAMASRARLTRMLPHRAEFEAQVMARRHKAGEADRAIRLAREKEAFLQAKLERARKRKDAVDRERADAEARARLDDEAAAAAANRGGERSVGRFRGGDAEGGGGGDYAGQDQDWSRNFRSGPAITSSGGSSGGGGASSAAAMEEGSWRRGPAAPAAAASAAAPLSAAPASGAGKYVPPSRRGAGGDSAGLPPPQASDAPAAPRRFGPTPTATGAASGAPVGSWRERQQGQTATAPPAASPDASAPRPGGAEGRTWR